MGKAFDLPKLLHPDFSVSGRKPVGAVEVDWSHPLAKYLDCCLVFHGNEGTTVQNLARPGSASFGNNSGGIDAVRGSDGGLQKRIANITVGSSEPVLIEDYGPISEGTLILSGQMPKSTTPFALFSLRSVDGSPDTVFYRSTDSAINVRINGNTVALTSSITLYGANTVKAITWSDAANDRSLYVNGALEASSATTFTWSDQSPKEYSLYGDNQGGGNITNGYQDYAFVFSKSLNADEIKSLYENPYQILKPAIPLNYFVSATSAAITGTATASINETDIKTTGGKTIIITLTGDTFKAAGTGPIGSTADTQALINNIDSAQAEANGWDAVVKAGLSTTDVARTSDTVATITLPAFASYDITAQETITVTVPTDVLVTGAGAITGSPTFTVDAVAAGTTVTKLAGHGGLAGLGGLAGRYGGLAG